MTVTVEEQETCLLATVDDGRANALSSEVIVRLRAALADAVATGRGLVVAGRDGSFCAGFDLAVMRSGDRQAIAALLTEGERLFMEMLQAPVAVAVACTGHALAGGALLLLSADWRVGRPGPYQLGLNEVRIGMALPEFAVGLVRHRLPVRHHTAATMAAEITEPARAVEIGFLDALADDPVAAACRWVEGAAANDQRAFAVTKRRLRRTLVETLAAINQPSSV